MNTRSQDIDAGEAEGSTGLTRREFLVRTVAGGGFMVGCALPGIGRHGDAQAATTSSNLTAWIIIGGDESVTIQIPTTEMGQGTMTGLAQIAADELRADWSRIKVVHAPVDAAHGGFNASAWGIRLTGGSLGIRLYGPVIQQAAANARQMLLTAAATYWGTATTALLADKGSIFYGTKSLSFGFLAASAAGVTLSGNTGLNQYPKTFVGTSQKRVDVAAKVDGSAKFGIDVFMPGMVFAAVRHCPTLGGTVDTVGSKPAGALAVVKVGANGVTGANGVAVVAATTWDAMQAVKKLGVTWRLPLDAAARDTNAINTRAAWLMANGAPFTPQSVNPSNLATGLAAPNVSITRTYQLPYLAHATMEPMNCTARFTPASGTTPARCEVWAPTQSPDAALATVKGLCPAGTVVTLENTLLGGGFGRKFEQDFVREAVQVAIAYPGKPVKLTWSREEDFSNDVYRPMSLSSIRAAASPATGRITSWYNRIVSPSISAQRGGDPSKDTSAWEGAAHSVYALDPVLVEYVPHDSPIPVGYWRSVGLSINTFPVECAIDELAVAIGRDPIAFRMDNLADPRMKGVLSALRLLSGWDTTPAAGRARGVAITSGFGSYVGQVAEISVNATTGAVTVHRVSTVIDCGMAVNPDMIAAQIEGAVAQAIAATLWVQQTFVNGVPQNRNFNRYRPLRMSEMPKIDVKVIANGDPVGGVGEPGVPCVAPAIANAYAKLRGEAARKRSLPFFPGSTLGGL